MSNGRVLVIAPGADFRKSLAFALETEGYVVTSHTGIPAGPAPRGYDAVVFDHKAASGPRAPVIEFFRRSPPLVLLAGMPQPWLSREAFTIVPTPLMGDALLRAVASAVHAGKGMDSGAP